MNHGSHVAMVYRRTEKTIRRLAQRHGAIVAAAREAASEGGMAAVQVAPVAARAGIAAGNVYRYFPSKTHLITALVAAVSEHEIGALQRAAEAAPGPLSALAAAIATFASRAMAQRRLAWAVIGEPVDPQAHAVRLVYRKALAAAFQTRIERAIRGGLLPAPDPALSAACAVGAMSGVLGRPGDRVALAAVLWRDSAADRSGAERWPRRRRGSAWSAARAALRPRSGARHCGLQPITPARGRA